MKIKFEKPSSYNTMAYILYLIGAVRADKNEDGKIIDGKIRIMHPAGLLYTLIFGCVVGPLICLFSEASMQDVAGTIKKHTCLL